MFCSAFSQQSKYQSGFSQIGNNGNIGIRGFTSWKKSSDKMLPPVGLEPGPLIASDSKFNTILSTLTDANISIIANFGQFANNSNGETKYESKA